MKNDEIRKLLPPNTLVFDSCAYDNSIIGITLDGRAIYCYERMIDEECTYEEAMDWIEYNTIRSLPYAGPKAPVIAHMEELGL